MVWFYFSGTLFIKVSHPGLLLAFWVIMSMSLEKEDFSQSLVRGSASMRDLEMILIFNLVVEIKSLSHFVSISINLVHELPPGFWIFSVSPLLSTKNIGMISLWDSSFSTWLIQFISWNASLRASSSGSVNEREIVVSFLLFQTMVFPLKRMI